MQIVWRKLYTTYPLRGEAILSKLTELEDKIKTLENKLESAPKDLAPPIGTYMYSKNNPASIYTGTIWQEIEGGTYLTAADDTNYTVGIVYGKNSLQLVANNIPAHTHTMAHTHTAGDLKNIDAGSHTHTLTMTSDGGNLDGTSRNIYFKSYGNSRIYTESVAKADSNGSHTHTINGNTGTASTSSTGSTGSNVAFNNMPKSIAIPLWTRTS